MLPIRKFPLLQLDLLGRGMRAQSLHSGGPLPLTEAQIGSANTRVARTPYLGKKA